MTFKAYLNLTFTINISLHVKLGKVVRMIASLALRTVQLLIQVMAGIPSLLQGT